MGKLDGVFAEVGIHRHMSRKYLGQYWAERDFVYNARKLTDDERTAKALKCARTASA